MALAHTASNRWISSSHLRPSATRLSRILAVRVRGQQPHSLAPSSPSATEQPRSAVLASTACMVAPLAPQPQQQEEAGWLGGLMSMFRSPPQEEWMREFGHLLNEAEERGSHEMYTSHLWERAAMEPRK